MRLSPILAAALLALAALPTAHAARPQLALAAPEGATQASAIVPVDVRLAVGEFTCHEPRAFTVSLFANATEGVKATWARSEVTFPVPAQTYFSETYHANETVNLTVRALQAGEVELTAVFSADVGPCFVPGGFESAATTLVLRVDPPSDAPAEDATVGPDPPAKPAAPRTAASASAAPSCGPDGGCGAIGDYVPPAQSSRDAPGLGLLAAAAALACASLARRRA